MRLLWSCLRLCGSLPAPGHPQQGGRAPAASPAAAVLLLPRCSGTCWQGFSAASFVAKVGCTALGRLQAAAAPCSSDAGTDTRLPGQPRQCSTASLGGGTRARFGCFALRAQMHQMLLAAPQAQSVNPAFLRAALTSSSSCWEAAPALQLDEGGASSARDCSGAGWVSVAACRRLAVPNRGTAQLHQPPLCRCRSGCGRGRVRPLPPARVPRA